MTQTVVLQPVHLPDVAAAALAGVSGPSGGPGGSPGVSVTLGGLFRGIGQTQSDGSGVALLQFGPVPTGDMWLLQRYIVHVENSPGSTCSLYVGDALTPNLEDGTLTGDLDVADGDPPIMVPGGEILTFQWVGAGAGNTCTARIQYALASAGG